MGNNLGDLEDLPTERLCNFVWWWLTNGRDRDDVERLRERIWMPPKGVVAKVGPWSAEEETAAFAALKSQLHQ